MTQVHGYRAATALALAVCLGAPACGPEPRSTATPAPVRPTAAAAPNPTHEVTPMNDTSSNETTPTAPAAQTLSAEAAATIFDTPVATLDGAPSSLGAHRGKALLVVNVASRCGLTPQYEGLEKLHEEYAARGFSVVGFPCNQFGGQEPGTAEEIKTFCSLTYGVTFPLYEKIEVNGPGRHPIYTELTRLPDTAGAGGDIRWNFEKFVIAADGRTVTRFAPQITPHDPAVIAAIEAALPR